MTTKNVGNEIYDGAADVGKVSVTISSFIMGFISIILFIAGVYLLLKKNVHTFTISSTVLDAECSQYAVKNQIKNNCNLHISYNYDGKTFGGKLTTSGEKYSKGDNVDIYIDPTNPSDYSTESLHTDRMAGWISIGIAIFIIAMTILNYYLTYKYKFFAAAQGAAFGVRAITGNNPFLV